MCMFNYHKYPMYLSFVEWDVEYIMSYSNRFTCVKFILNTYSHHQYECIEMMYTNLAIPILAYPQVYHQQRDLY